MSMDGPDSRTDSCICEPGMPLATNRPCWRRCSPTAPIWASPAWPMSRAALATITSSSWRSGTSATTTTSPPAPLSSTRPASIRWRRSGTTGQPHRRTSIFLFPARRSCGRWRFRQSQIRHRSRRGSLHARVRPLWTVLHAGHFGDDERSALRARRPAPSCPPNRSAHYPQLLHHVPGHGS
jgi:hypothetical protein